MDVISTRQVAELLAVSEATVKRWADAGTIRCFRTPGGHRKFRMADVSDFLRTHNYDTVGSVGPGAPASPAGAGPTGREDASAQTARADCETAMRFRDMALAGDPDALVSLVAQQRLRGMTLSEVFDGVVTPALHDVGDRWARGVLTVAQEHIAAQCVIEALARIRTLIERSSADRGRVVLACPGEEQHDIALRMASLLAQGAGYVPVLIGARTPVTDLALMVTGDRPRLVVISSTGAASAVQLARDVNVVAEAAAGVNARLIAGGAGFDALAALPAGVQRVRSFSELVQAMN